MSQGNVEVIRRAFEAFNAGDYSVFLKLYDRDIVLCVPPGVIESGVFHGAKEVERYYRRWFGPFGGTTRLEIEELIEAGDSVIAIHRETARGRLSGAEVDRLSISIHTMRGGKIIRIDHPASREAALETVGLSEKDWTPKPKAPP
jgi:ketosteroid isomerase-like protein